MSEYARLRELEKRQIERRMNQLENQIAYWTKIGNQTKAKKFAYQDQKTEIVGTIQSIIMVLSRALSLEREYYNLTRG